jgi:hypothetical protein
MFLFSPLATGYFAIAVIFLIYWAASINMCALVSGATMNTYVVPELNSKFISALAIAACLTMYEIGYLDQLRSSFGF